MCLVSLPQRSASVAWCERCRERFGSSVVLTVATILHVRSHSVRLSNSDSLTRNNRETRTMGSCDESIYLGFDFSTQQVNVLSAVWSSMRNLLNMWQTIRGLNFHYALRNSLGCKSLRSLSLCPRAMGLLTTHSQTADYVAWWPATSSSHTATLYWINSMSRICFLCIRVYLFILHFMCLEFM